MPRSSRSCFMCESKQFVHTKADCSFHKFPTDQLTLSKWLEFSNLTAADKVSSLFICSKHFSPDQFYRHTTKDQSYKLNLKKGAIPTIKKPGAGIIGYAIKSKSFLRVPPVELSQDVTPQIVENVPPVAGTSRSTISLHSEVKNEEHTTDIHSNTVDPLKGGSTRTLSFFLKVENQQSVTHTCNKVDSLEDLSTLKKKRFTEPRYLGDIRTLDVETPRRAKLCLRIARETVAKQAKKIRALQKSKRLMKKRIQSLVDLVNQLKKKDFISQM